MLQFYLGFQPQKPLSENKTTKCQRWKSLDLDAFKSDFSMSDMHLIPESNSMSDAGTTYNTILQDLIDKHAPEYDRTFKPRHHTPWYNSTVRDAKRLRRRLERRWRKTQSEQDREAYRSQCQVVRDKLVKAKSEHYHNKLSEADNHKDVYSIANSLLFGPKVQKLPIHDSVQDLSEQFADYFIQKIVTIRNGLCQNINTDNQCDETDVILILGSLKPATDEEISKIICSSASKSYDLDPIPTWLLKLCLSELLPVITYIVNLSLSTSTVPYALKLALITPLLKKVLLDPEVLKNFHPVSNLTYLSKSIERVVVVRLNQQLIQNGLHEVLQSAYKQNNNTETALLKVQNDLLMAIDTHGGAVLILLDLSAAFDTIDHTILLQRLHQLGIRDAIRLVQILFEPAETIRCYQLHKIIISKSVFRSASGISAWPNTLHPVYNTAGHNSTEISAKFPSLCWWHTIVHGLQAKQCGIITPNHQEHPKLCHWHQVLDDGEHVTTKHGQNRGFSADKQKPQKSHYHEQNQNWFNRYINCKQRRKSWCYIWQCFKLRSFCELHLQICPVQFIQYQQKPKSPTTDAAKILIQAYVMSKIDIATACWTASQKNYCIVFSEFRTMLLGGSSECINSAISHQHWPHYTGSLSIAGLISRSHCWFTKP